MRDRVRRVFERVPSDVEAIVLHNNVSPHVDMAFFHATDLVSGGVFERAVAILRRDGTIDLASPMLEETSARRAADARVSTFSKGDERNAWIAEQLKGVAKAGINPPELVVQDHRAIVAAAPKTELVDVSKELAATRAVKDAAEIARMRKAARIVSEVADLIPSFLRDGTKEFELAAEISYAMQKRGATGPSFESIVAFGEGSAEPHYSPHDVALAPGMFALCDFGAWYERYASDITRTWMRGPPSKEMRDIYDTTLRAHQAALDAVRGGAKGEAVHVAAEKVINASPWKGRFIHSIGHTLGLAVHDGGVLHPRMPDLVLEPGMVVTIEPGIYVSGIGGVRIEDDVLVTKSGYELLTTATRDAVVV
jgi:Xaa-Pro dipeptidase